MKKCVNGSFVTLLALMWVLLAAPNASAAVRLTLSSGGSTLVINDNDLNDLANPQLGAIVFAGSLGTWTFNVVTGTNLGSPNPLIDLNGSNTGSGTGANALTMIFSSTDNTGPVLGFTSHIGGTLAAGHSLTYEAWVNSNNTLDAMQTSIGGSQSFGPGPGSFSGDVSGGSTAASLYGLTQQVVLSGTTIGTSSFDGAVFPVPEPASSALFGGVLLFTGLALRRKAKSTTV